MRKSLDPKITEFLATIGRKGGRNRAKSHTAAELRSWGRRGGRPRLLDAATLKLIQKLRLQGFSLEAISKKLHVSVGTVWRATKDFRGK